MTADKLRSVIAQYVVTLGVHVGERWPDQAAGDPNLPLCRLCHAKWMLAEMSTFIDEGRLDKAFRWLGFVQGVFWCEGVHTIDEMKEHNMPQGGEENV